MNLTLTAVSCTPVVPLSKLPVVGEGIDDIEMLAQSQWVDRRRPAEGINLLSRAAVPLGSTFSKVQLVV